MQAAGVIVAFDTRTDDPHFPGIGRYTRNLAAALRRTAAARDALVSIGPSNCRASPRGLRQQWAVPPLVRQLAADLYHSPYYLMPLRPGVPCVVTLHDLIPLQLPQHFSVGQRVAFGLAIRLATRRAHIVITVSERTRREAMERLHLDPQRLVAIPEAADPLFQPPPPPAVAALRARLRLPDRYALYVGSNKPHKNLVRLVEAWAQLRDPVPLVIAGPWDARFPVARQRGASLAAAGRLRWLGRVADADLPALYGGATCALVPSESEGFGLPVLEAMACGTPVACARAGSLPEVAGDAAVFFDPLDVAAIVEVVNHLLTHAEHRTTLAQQGLRRAAAFSWDAAAQRTWDAYRHVLR